VSCATDVLKQATNETHASFDRLIVRLLQRLEKKLNASFPSHFIFSSLEVGRQDVATSQWSLVEYLIDFVASLCEFNERGYVWLGWLINSLIGIS